MNAPLPLQRLLRHRPLFAVWCVVAAFGCYGCMYGFRKPFTAASYDDGSGDLSTKALLVTAQVLGYTLSKLIGIRVVAAMAPARRAAALLTLIGVAWLSLLAFAVVPAPWRTVCMFANGLPLGMVYGLVLGFLEGRRLTELFVAGQCASFILADGFTKSIGTWLLQAGVRDAWMPATAGAVFLLPLLGFVWMLRRIPSPDGADVAARSARSPMRVRDQLAMLRRHGLGLGMIVLAYLLITVLRSVRADFAPEIWAGLGFATNPATFTWSETWVALGIVIGNGLMVLVNDNRRALMVALAASLLGVAIAGLAVSGCTRSLLTPFPFMVLLGLGLYVPYVAVHTTIFERLVALTRERGNIGFLMYVADSVGYLGYAALTIGKGAMQVDGDFVTAFLDLNAWLLALTAIALGLAAWIYARRTSSGATNWGRAEVEGARSGN